VLSTTEQIAVALVHVRAHWLREDGWAMLAAIDRWARIGSARRNARG
jgi:hypothetical protein